MRFLHRNPPNNAAINYSLVDYGKKRLIHPTFLRPSEFAGNDMFGGYDNALL